VFRCPIRFAANSVEMCFAPRILALPHMRADSPLLAVLMRYADSLLQARPVCGDLVARASSTIARQMARALPTLASTAAELRMSKRTLQRTLARNGVSHSTLVEDIRRQLAVTYIGAARLSIAEISYILHYGDTTVFHRAFKRWTGETPLAYRRQLLLGQRRRRQ
jgi:AraC-like DNA-binding protein